MAANELQEKIAKQMDYYFSDYNLLRDKFMKEQIAKDEGGWIPISVFLTFNRLKALTTDPQAVVDAIKSSQSELIEISEDSTKLRRSPNKPLPEQSGEYREQVLKRTVHIKGFPLDSTFDQLWSYCGTLGPLESLQMRKHRKGTFKGCVLAVFKNLEDANRIVGETLKYGEKELLKEKEEVHMARKLEFFKNKKKNLKKNPKGAANQADIKKDSTEQLEESSDSSDSDKNDGTAEMEQEKAENGKEEAQIGEEAKNGDTATKREHPVDDETDPNANGKAEEEHSTKKVKLDETANPGNGSENVAA